MRTELLKIISPLLEIELCERDKSENRACKFLCPKVEVFIGVSVNALMFESRTADV